MARVLDERFMDNTLDPEYYETYERIYGWECWYCKREHKTQEEYRNKGETCTCCGRTKEEAKI